MAIKHSPETPRLLTELRSLRVLLIHPSDSDRQELMLQLQRIGCQVKAIWPPPDGSPKDVDLVIFAVRPEVLSLDLPWLRREDRPAVIAVVTYENPTILEAVLALDAHGVIASPVRSFGLLTSIVLARHQFESKRASEKYMSKLERRLTGLRKMAKAKEILMQTHTISEQDAYSIIRNQAMVKRITTEEIADAVIKASKILALDTKMSRT
jgi:AmiR/NasT family two-component response regulator